MEDALRFGLLTIAALAVAALYLAAVRLIRGDGPAAITPAGVGTIFILSFAAVLGAPLTGIAQSAGVGIVLSLASGLVLAFGAVALLDTFVPKAFRAMQPLAEIFLLPMVAAIGALPFGLLMRLAF